MQVMMNAKTLKWLIGFTDTDLTNNRGLQNLILTRIIDTNYIIATNGHIAIFYKVDILDECNDITENKCVFFNKKDKEILKNVTDSVVCYVDFENQTWHTLGGIAHNIAPLRDCYIDFQNWLQFNFINNEEELTDKDKYQHALDIKLLNKFCYDKNSELIIYPLTKKILLVKIPNDLTKFGFICKMNTNNVELSQLFENTIEKLNIKLKQEIKEVLINAS